MHLLVFLYELKKDYSNIESRVNKMSPGALDLYIPEEPSSKKKYTSSCLVAG